MIPSILASQIHRGVEEFLRTTFPMTSPGLDRLLDGLFDDRTGVRPSGGMFRGPYLSLKLPFRSAELPEGLLAHARPGFAPYEHQLAAFRRLAGTSPRSTIVATGTGSGKTECFLYPVLEHCFRERGREGIKAILIYPMNALAGDQAQRIARAIWDNPDLRGNVTAGLFVGDKDREPRTTMERDGIITDRETLRATPPDILLTNYKMLDYLMVRPRDVPLWAGNTPETLRFLVVDELHTFDGAQGSDLACLVRRLKHRLSVPAGQLCCVGTSATLGADDSSGALRRFAEEIFGEPFDDNSIITESRQSIAEFLDGVQVVNDTPIASPTDLRFEEFETEKQYLTRQHHVWFDESPTDADLEDGAWRVGLGERLRANPIFQNLLRVVGTGAVDMSDVADRFLRNARLREKTKEANPRELLDSMVALIALARSWRSAPNGATRPFVEVRLQYWLRELRRMVAPVTREPAIRFADDLRDDERELHLPVVHCRDCGSAGWAGVQRSTETHIDSDLSKFYRAFFAEDHHVRYLFPLREDAQREVREGDEGAELGGRVRTEAAQLLCGACLRLSSVNGGEARCPSCDSTQVVRVFVPDTSKVVKDVKVGSRTCPFCSGSGTLTILGSQSASLSSVTITQLFASRFNDDRKLITFSDSVQDASHRAAFFAARTFRFNLRAAIQQYLTGVEGTPTVQELVEGFKGYWIDRLGPETYAASFIAPDMMWLEEYDLLRRSGELDGGGLLDLIGKRIEWEVVSEYGYQARIGRSLEKTNCSVAAIDPNTLDSAIEPLLLQLQNEVGLRDLDADHLRRYLLGLLTHLRHQGAVLIEDLEEYVSRAGSAWVLNKRMHLPRFGRQSRAPVFLTRASAPERFEPVETPLRARTTWCEAWVDKCFRGLNPAIASGAAQALRLTLDALVSAGVLAQRKASNDPVWGIDAGSLRVTTAVAQFRCTTCGHATAAPADESSSWTGMPCLRFDCSGTYAAQPIDGLDYYGTLYRYGSIRRIVSAEHTGLLTREVREEIEDAFKSADPKPWDPNLLSCTPTLEMGIDIGDLSTVLLCSIPPTQTNYLQRIGRAGRRDGNALTLAVANGRPHDLYFFSEPSQMIAGTVEPPRIFLQAPAVLERQFAAFCLDTWVRTGLPKTAIPYSIGAVLDTLEHPATASFPHNLLLFLDHSQSELFDRFVRLFEGALTVDAVERLRGFVEGDVEATGSLRNRIIEALTDRLKEVNSLRRNVRQLSDKISKKQKEPAQNKEHDNELAEMQRELAGLKALVRSLRERDPYQVLTEEGLIPNYAFPEAGISLRSVIYRKRSKGGTADKAYDVQVYEYERPAAAAIHELAPANRFYAEGRRVQIDQVSVDLSETTTWRFCDQCTYAEMEGVAEKKSACPRCGSPLWADAGQVQSMIRLRQVVASTSDRDSRVYDDSDDREPTFFNKQMLVDFDRSAVTDSFLVEDASLPFGFEFLSQATFREINFGRHEAPGEKMKVAGREVARTGFTLCRRCGKVQLNPKKPIEHTPWCTARESNGTAALSDYCFLFREFQSEAIRVLLPVGVFEGAEDLLYSFIAAVQLGLRRHFGRVDHLQATIQEEPVPESTVRRRFLVLFDTVPGGTGYLKQLMKDQQPVMDVFRAAYDAMTQCGCVADEEKDGCYRCVYAYRNSSDRPAISRRLAVDLVRRILEHADDLRRGPIATSPVGGLEESELELRFIEALRRTRSQEEGTSLRREPINGKPGYLLRIAGRTWEIEPQVNLGPNDGVAIKSRVDFILRPKPAHEGVLPVAVFTDGLRFHVDRVGEDLAQRMAIARSGRYAVWSLTWQDVQSRLEPKKAGDTWERFQGQQSFIVGRMIGALHEYYTTTQFTDAHADGSFGLLLRYLREPRTAVWQRFAIAFAAQFTDGQSSSPEAFNSALATECPEDLVSDMVAAQSDLRGVVQGADDGTRLYLALGKRAITHGDPSHVHVAMRLNDSVAARNAVEFEYRWNGFLRLTNILQFCAGATFVSRSGVERGCYEKLIGARPAPPAEDTSPLWRELQGLVAPALWTLLEVLRQRGWEPPEAGYELASSDGSVLAEAELASVTRRVAFLRADQAASADVFGAHGWRALMLDDVLTNPAAIPDDNDTN